MKKEKSTRERVCSLEKEQAELRENVSQGFTSLREKIKHINASIERLNQERISEKATKILKERPTDWYTSCLAVLILACILVIGMAIGILIR